MYRTLAEVAELALERFKETHGLSFDPTIQNVVKYYKRLENRIIEHSRERPFQFYDAYAFDWFKLFTPIEKEAWNIIRTIGSVVLYPQYPVGNYRPDFANPVKKIIVECDGKAFHDEEKDFERDTNLWKEGWRVFRVTGSELYRIVERETVEPDDIRNEDEMLRFDGYTQQSLEDFYLGTAEGVITAIRDIYFLKNHNPYNYEGRLQYKTLNNHRLVNFPL